MKKFTLFAVAIATFNLGFSQKKADTDLLKKYEQFELYQSESQLNMEGEWKGTEIQYDRTGSFITAKYDYEFNLEQDGNRITGTSMIVDADGNYSEMNLRGYVIGNKFHFEEYEITDEIMEKFNTIWCYTTGELDITSSKDKVELKGPLDGYSSDNYRVCDATEVTLEKVSGPNVVQSSSEDITSTLASIDDVVSISSYPNPFRTNVTLEYTLHEDANVLLEIFDLRGKRIRTLVNTNQQANTYQFNLTSDDFENTSGVYLAKLKVNDQVFSKQFVQSK
ncbi:MAG: T9SS type A sorting domain-containing protein [Flavobacteriales bacterium]|nr:T9SS type A sorting domain-containing protein [Flavobacteriales bacterium]